MLKPPDDVSPEELKFWAALVCLVAVAVALLIGANHVQ